LSARQLWLTDPNPILPWIDGSYTTAWDTTLASAAVVLDGIELICMIRKGQMLGARAQNPSLADQFNRLAA